MRINKVEFTKEMKQDYTILVPNMLPTHFALIEKVLISNGYNAILLKNTEDSVLKAGLKYVHNDTCYPALCVIGQFLDALQSGEYDTNKTALMITQTGGGCRASNYIHLLRKALVQAGLEHVPVISLNLSGLEKNSGFKLTLPLLRQMIACLVYGDMLMLLKNQIQPYEVTQGDTLKLTDLWQNKLCEQICIGKGLSMKDLKNNLSQIVKDYAAIKIQKRNKTRVGIVGEIYVKYSPLGNNELENFLSKEGCEVNVPGVMDFMLFKVDNRLEDIRLYGGNKLKYAVVKWIYDYFLKMEDVLIDTVKQYKQFVAPAGYVHLKKLVDGVVGYGNKMGEGWLLTAEMLELAQQGYENIICTQPFGCLPNHIIGKGMIRKIKEIFPNTNIVPIDYDPGASKVNQENRIKLMLSLAKKTDEKIEIHSKTKVTVNA